MTLNQITASIAAVVMTVVSLLMWALAVVLNPPAIESDPTRYCYAESAFDPMSCYLKDDRPAGLNPVWVGPESLIPREPGVRT